MNTEQLKAFCRNCAGATETESGAPHNILVYSIDDKKFAYFKTSEPQKWRFSVRVTPSQFIELTDQPNIKPARYMGRFHWITIVDVERIDAAVLRKLVECSYTRALSSLSKKRQSELGKML